MMLQGEDGPKKEEPSNYAIEVTENDEGIENPKGIWGKLGWVQSIIV